MKEVKLMKTSLSQHWSYLKYVLRHKLYVLQHRKEFGVGLIRALLHDMSKFSKAEWGPYARNFYELDGSKRTSQKTSAERESFKRAWEHHLHFNPHHWDFWSNNQQTAQIPDKFAREMVLDWVAAGLAISGKRDEKMWYLKNRNKMFMNPITRMFVESLLGVED